MLVAACGGGGRRMAAAGGGARGGGRLRRVESSRATRLGACIRATARGITESDMEKSVREMLKVIWIVNLKRLLVPYL